MVRISTRRALGGFERLLLLSGILMLVLFAAAHLYNTIYSSAAMRSFWRTQSSSSRVTADSSHRSLAIPDFHSWSQKRIEAYQASLFAPVQPPLGVLRFTSINLEVPVLEGTDDLSLNRGAGHIEGTPAPGESGNVGIAAHRDGFFRTLRNIHLGDPIDLITEKGNVRYVVDEIVIVPPDDLSVLAPRSKPALTLVTCYPFYFVGSAPLRYIVSATITDSNDLADSRQSRSLAEERVTRNSH